MDGLFDVGKRGWWGSEGLCCSVVSGILDCYGVTLTGNGVCGTVWNLKDSRKYEGVKWTWSN